MLAHSWPPSREENPLLQREQSLKVENLKSWHCLRAPQMVYFHFILYSVFVFVRLYFFQLKIQAQGEQYRKLENFKLWHCFLAVHKVYCPFQMPTNIHNRQFTEKNWEVKSKQILKKLSESKQIVGQKSWILRHLGNIAMQWRGKRQCCIAACIMNAAA